MRVFVTRELYPFTAGGIGRVVGNILATSTDEELRSTAVVCISSDIDRERFEAVYPQVTFVGAPLARYRAVGIEGAAYPPTSAYSDHYLHGESVLAMQALMELERAEGPLGYVEFPDWGGLAFASCQEKRLGRAFESATLAVRLHTTDSVLGAVERRLTDVHALALYDLERKALADSDLIVAQLATVGERMRRFYGFSEADWNPRVHLHAPPVLLDGVPAATEAIDVGPDTPITFTSKIQHVKRPDVLVRGCCEFLSRHPENRSSVQFLAHAFDAGYLDAIKALIPDDLQERFSFVGGVSGAARERLIARSVCVFPSSWESFCLAAYEASLSGAACVVNSANPAFGDGTPWVAHRNCETFDGSAAGLAQALSAVFSAPRRQVPVVVPPDPVPWKRPAPASASLAPSIEPVVTVVVSHLDDAVGLAATLDSVAGSSYPMIDTLVVDRGSRDPVASDLLARVAAVPSVQRVDTLYHDTVGATFNRGIGQASGEFLVLLESGDQVEPSFIADAVAALRRGPEFFAVTGQHRRGHRVGHGVGHGDHAARGVAGVAVVHGEARAHGLYEDSFAGPACLVRAAQAGELGFRDDLDADARWEFHGRAVRAGHRYVVSSRIEGGNCNAPVVAADALLARIRAHDMLRDKSYGIDGITLPCYTMAAGMHHRAPASDDVHHLQARLREYDTSETVFAALTIARAVQRRAPWLLTASRWSMRTGWRWLKAVRGNR